MHSLRSITFFFSFWYRDFLQPTIWCISFFFYQCLDAGSKHEIDSVREVYFIFILNEFVAIQRSEKKKPTQSEKKSDRKNATHCNRESEQKDDEQTICRVRQLWRLSDRSCKKKFNRRFAAAVFFIRFKLRVFFHLSSASRRGRLSTFGFYLQSP